MTAAALEPTVEDVRHVAGPVGRVLLGTGTFSVTSAEVHRAGSPA